MGKYYVERPTERSLRGGGLPTLVGQRFGRLVVVAKAPHKGIRRAWICACDCGSPFKSILQISLRNGNTRSCGCVGRDMLSANATKHGMSKTSEYKIWQKIILRCEYEDCWEYRYYGGRGIKICPEWRNSFLAFYGDMGARPSREYTVDRIDNNGDYCPENCRWATRFEQSMNRRNTRFMTANGITKTRLEWAKDLNASVDLIRNRMKLGWSEEDAVTIPVFRGDRRHCTRKGSQARVAHN